MLVPCTFNWYSHRQDEFGDLDQCDLELGDWDGGESKGQRG